MFATDLSIELARRHGAGVVAVHRSSHYGAAGYYAIRAAEAGMVGDLDHELRAVRGPLRRHRPRARHQPDRDRRADSPTGSGTPTWPPARSRSTRSSTRATRAARSPRAGASTRRAAPPPTPARSTPPCRSAATRATRSRSWSRCSPACCRAPASATASGASTRASPRTSGTSTSPSTSSAWPAASTPRSCSARLLGDLKAIPPAPGFDEVLVPGEPEQRTQAERERDGIPLPPTLWTTLGELSGNSACRAAGLVRRALRRGATAARSSALRGPLCGQK